MSIESGNKERDPRTEMMDKVQQKFVTWITEATTPEALMAAFDKAVGAADVLDIDEPLYRHPEGGSNSIIAMRAEAQAYLEAALAGNEDRMYALSDVGLPPEFKKKALEFGKSKSQTE